MAKKMNPVHWFEISVKEIERARAFYEQVLGVALEVHELGPLTMAWFPMSPGAGGAMGSLVKADAYTPSHAGTMVYFSVQDIEATLELVRENGGTVLNPKTSIGDFGFVGHFEDCEGNRVGLHADQ